MESRTAESSRNVTVVLLALLAVVALLLWMALRESSNESATESDASSEPEEAPDERSASRARPRAALRSAEMANSETTAPPAAGEPVLVDGWPAADILVRRSDGTPAPGALVYVIAAGEPSPWDLDRIPRHKTGSDGTVRFPVAVAGRYDVGASVHGIPFNGLSLDVSFPATSPAEVVLPDHLPLEIRKEGDIPGSGWVTIALADAARISARPGRRESRYVGGQVSELGDHVLVPRGARMRVRSTGGLVATPDEVVAPGPVTLRPDPRRETNVEFVFVADTELAARWFQFRFRIEETPGVPDPWVGRDVRLAPAPHETTLPVTLDCRPGLTTVRWRCSSDPGRAGGEAVLDAAADPAGGVHRIQVPVRLEDFHVFGFRVVAPPGTDARTVRALTSFGTLFEHEVVPGREYWFASPIESRLGDPALSEPIVAVARSDDVWLVSGPVSAALSRVVDLPLVAGGRVRIRFRVPPVVGGSWPLEVRRAQSSLLADLLIEQPAPALVRDARFQEHEGPAVLGPFPAGDVELAFRFGGREIGRRTVRVVPGTTIDVEAPEILPPPR